MKFSKIKIHNFRQYYDDVEIDLNVNEDQNIILFGGKNGYGKTNFLISVVWCLYGRLLEKVDDNFKQEIRKEKNYDAFMRESLNWTAKRDNKDKFSVSILISELKLPEIHSIQPGVEHILITRSYNVSKVEEYLSISDVVTKKELFDDEEDKVNFINDYVIPIDAAKFVFFDAEKISEIADLSIKKEGDFINDALSKILGLDIYASLIEDMNFFISNLKRQGAKKNLQEEILNKESAIKLSENQIESTVEKNAEYQKEIADLKKKISEIDAIISQHSKQGNNTIDRASLLQEIDTLKVKEKKLADQFSDLSEVIPLAILTGKIEEVNEQLKIQKSNVLLQTSSEENKEKIKLFIDKLFNKPPYPEESKITLDEQLFYRNKASDIGKELFEAEGDNYQELLFEHDLNNAESEMISDALSLVNTQSKQVFETTISEYNEVKIELTELEKKKKRIDADEQDEYIIELIEEKEDEEKKRGDKKVLIGKNIQKIEGLEKDISRLKKELKTLYKKIEVNTENRKKVKEAEKYISALNDFITEQKLSHKQSLENSILNELKLLMHKLKKGDNKFIEGVSVTILSEGLGMNICLLDQDGKEIRKEILSSGEKQIYISSLIKAILNESVQKSPIFIDTPLGRLDQEHRDSITKKYYPELSEQVILFSTDSEITPRRHKSIIDDISKSYLMVYDGVNTKISQGYFNTISND